MCSYHRVFLGAALTGILPKPKCTVYTNLACDGNMMTFPYLKQTYELPGFYIDVPYEKNQDSVRYVAGQLRELKRFLEEVTGKRYLKRQCRRQFQIAGKQPSIIRGSLHYGKIMILFPP